MLRTSIAAAALVGILSSGGSLEAQSLRGSPASLTVQNRQARGHDFTYLNNRAHVQRFVSLGLLVHVAGNGDYRLHAVSYPYARPEVKTFIERLAAQYRSACGEPLVVTSLVRPESMRLWNASSRSVHPTGMAIDLRKSRSGECRRWLERVLLQLEAQGVLEATEEFHPPHYHIALFPQPYERYLASLGERAAPPRATLAAADDAADAGSGATETLSASFIPHTVLRGESLWRLAREFGTSVAELMAFNRLDSPEIRAGQELKIPTSQTVVAAAPAAPSHQEYRVDRGDNLWTIARRHQVSVNEIKEVNGLRSSRILPGMVLKIPVGAR